MTANKTIKRYDMEGAAGGAVAMEDDTGEWVRYEDHIAEMAALKDSIVGRANGNIIMIGPSDIAADILHVLSPVRNPPQPDLEALTEDVFLCPTNMGNKDTANSKSKEYKSKKDRRNH